MSLATTDALEQNDINLTFNYLERISHTVCELFYDQGIELDRESAECKRLYRELLKTEQQALLWTQRQAWHAIRNW